MARSYSYSRSRKFPDRGSGLIRPLWGLDTRGESSINFKHPLTRGWVVSREQVIALSPSMAPGGVLTVTDHEIRIRKR